MHFTETKADWNTCLRLRGEILVWRGTSGRLYIGLRSQRTKSICSALAVSWMPHLDGIGNKLP